MLVNKFSKASISESSHGSSITMVVENPQDWWNSSNDRLDFPDIDIIMLTDLNEHYLGQINPSIIVTALFGVTHDAADIAERLASCGYQGRFRATSQSLPNPPLVRRELAGMFPDLDVDILIMNATHS